MAYIDSPDITVGRSRLTVRFPGGGIVAAPLTARVDTETGDVTLHTDPATLTPVDEVTAASAAVTRAGGSLSGVVVAFLVAPEGVEEVELTGPWAAVRDAGGTPVLVSTVPGEIAAFNHLDRAGTYPVDHLAADVSATDFDALVLPGGVANPDYLRTRTDAVELVRDVVTAGLPVAAICHAPCILIDAGVIDGRRLTSWPSLRTDLRNAGAEWLDREVVTCDSGPNTIVTSRGPVDLDAFCRVLVADFARSAAQRPSRME